MWSRSSSCCSSRALPSSCFSAGSSGPRPSLSTSTGSGGDWARRFTGALDGGSDRAWEALSASDPARADSGSSARFTATMALRAFLRAPGRPEAWPLGGVSARRVSGFLLLLIIFVGFACTHHQIVGSGVNLSLPVESSYRCRKTTSLAASVLISTQLWRFRQGFPVESFELTDYALVFARHGLYREESNRFGSVPIDPLRLRV